MSVRELIRSLFILSLCQVVPSKIMYELHQYTISYNGYRWKNISRHQVGLFLDHTVCLGTLLTFEFAITTSGCFEFDKNISRMIAVAGSTDFNKYDPRVQVRHVKKFVINEHYIPGVLGSDDVAIVQFTSPFYGNCRISLAALPDTLMFTVNKTMTADMVYVHITSPVYNYTDEAGQVNNEYLVIPPDVDKYKCKCIENVTHEDVKNMTSDNGTVISRLLCFYFVANSNDMTLLDEVMEWDWFAEICPTVDGAAIMIGDTLVAIKHYSYPKSCKKYKRKKNYLKHSNMCDSTKSLTAFLQVYYYRDWINTHIPDPAPKARIKKPKIISHNFDIKPHLPIILYTVLLLLLICLFLICNNVILAKMTF